MYIVERFDDTAVIYVTGDLDIAASAKLESTLALAASLNIRRIVVSLEGCDFCDAPGLQVLLRAHKSATTQLTVVVPDDARCRRVLRVTGLCKVLRLVPTMQRALSVEAPVAVKAQPMPSLHSPKWQTQAFGMSEPRERLPVERYRHPGVGVALGANNPQKFAR